MAKYTDPLAHVRNQICEAWENWPGRTENGYIDPQNMLAFYSAINSERIRDIKRRLPPGDLDQNWQRVKYLLKDYEKCMGRDR